MSTMGGQVNFIVFTLLLFVARSSRFLHLVRSQRRHGFLPADLLRIEHPIVTIGSSGFGVFHANR